MEVKEIIDDFQNMFTVIRYTDSKKTMAKKLGVSLAYLSMIQNGKRKCPQVVIQKMIKEYQLTEEQEKDVLDTYKKYNFVWELFNLSQKDKSSIQNCHAILKRNCEECKYNCAEHRREVKRERYGIR